MRITPIDDKKANEGSTFKYMGVPLVIARGNNENFKKVFRTLTKPYQREIDRGSMKNELAEELLCKALAQTVLLGWDAEKMPGNFPYTVDNAESLLLNDTDCRAFVLDVSREAENFYTEDAADRLAN